jgi:signal transduction histidine kinase
VNFHGGKMNESHFRFSPDVLVRLGEELIPNPEQGIIELVKNSYDADALTCTVELANTDRPGGKVVISDTGLGMSGKDIADGFLVIGSSKKSLLRELTKLGRLPVGDKGLGRLAGLRLGSTVQLHTRPYNEPGVEYTLTIDWAEFLSEQIRVVEQVDFEIGKRRSNRAQGTDIIISNLKAAFTKRDITRLARELVLLSDPFDDSQGFRPRLVTHGFSELEELVNNAYFPDAEFHLAAALTTEGLAEAQLLDWKGKVLAEADHRKISGSKDGLPYKIADARFELWVFLLNQTSFSARKATIAEVRNWLSVVGGVHLYHRGLRVRPYGDQGHDWLEMNLARARSPEERPSTNTTIGRVTIEDPSDMLVQKTDRIGFIENEAFLELKKFANDVLNWMADYRMKMAEKRREKAREDAPKNLAIAKAKLVDLVRTSVPPSKRDSALKVVDRYDRLVGRSITSLRDDLQLYRSVATAGSTSAVFAHETGRTATLIGQIASTVENRGRKLLGLQFPENFEKSISLLNQISGLLRSFSALPLYLLLPAKRRSGAVDVHAVITKLLTVFEPYLQDAGIDARCQFVNGKPNTFGSESLLEAILANFLTNSVTAFNAEGAQNDSRTVVIRTEMSGDSLLLKFMDNGPGITGIELDEIWLPGKTTKPGGTGFGLTIVKDSVADLGGKVYPIAKGELGGAEFVVELPLSGA